MSNVRALGALLLAIVFALASGCAVYNPYVNADRDSSPCPSPLRNDGLSQACSLRDRIAGARKQHIVAQNWIATGLIPLSGVVGYRTARGLGTASTAALATGGLAAYTLDQFLIQPSRFVVYDKAYTAVSCALSLYFDERGSVIQEYPDYASVLAAKGIFDAEVRKANDDNLSVADKKILASFVSEAAFFELAISGRATAILDGKLAAATQRIEAEIATAITTTALPITSLSSQIEPLSKPASPPSEPPPGEFRGVVSAQVLSITTPGGDALSPSTNLLAVFKALTHLHQAYKTATNTVRTAQSAADFSKCSVGVVQVQNPGIEQPLMLGVDNAEAGSTKELAPGQQVNVQIVGGRAPHDAKLAVANDELEVNVVAVGATRAAVVSAKADAKQEGIYEVLVSDAAGSLRRFSVKVVKKQ